MATLSHYPFYGRTLPTVSKPRLVFLAIFIQALFEAATVNLSLVSRYFNPKVDQKSNQRRCSRFLEKAIPQQLIAKFTLNIIGFYNNNDRVLLVMDRTNWKFGSTNINFLIISIAYAGFAIPLAWVQLEKAGNSNANERKTLLLEVLKLIPSERIEGFAANREFIGQAWFTTLLETGVNPVLRIKSDTNIQHREIKAPASVWFSSLKPDSLLELSKARVYGIRVFVIGILTKDKEFLLLVTQKRPSKSLALYAGRWLIECLFKREQPVRCCLVSKKALKSSGFNVEDTHMTGKTRLESLLGVLSLGVVWSVLTGVLVNSRDPIAVKKHGRLAVSIFKLGFESLVKVLRFGVSKFLVLDEALMLLSGT